MNMNYFNTYYKNTFEGNSHPITVLKHDKNEWVTIEITNRAGSDSISITSEQDLQSLHFCLGQILSMSKK